MALLSVHEAHKIIMQHARVMPHETVQLAEATGRILAEPVYADRDYPPINRSTMDGIAVCAGTPGPWRIEATIPAGHAAAALHDAHEGCARIMTGAEIPSNADAVVPVEDVEIQNECARLKPGITVKHGQFIHAKSADRRKGELILSPGIRLDAPRIAILAVLGCSSVRVAVQPRVAIITTGNEIVPVDYPNIQPAQTRSSNRHGLEAGLTAMGITPYICMHVRDDAGTIQQAIERALASCHLLLLSGGVSKGAYDYVPGALAAAGVKNIFHGVAQRPGKPLWFGTTSECLVFGLPGNPVSSLTVFRRYVVSCITKSLGAVEAEPILMHGHHVATASTLTQFLPVRVAGNYADKVEYHGSGDLAALAMSDGFLEIPPGSNENMFVFYRW